MTSYQHYVSDEKFISEYAEYQQKYAGSIRESDKVLVELVRGVAGARTGLTLLDIGCSTGNLLLHLKRAVPGLTLVGGDLTAGVIEDCRRNEELAGIRFEVMNMLKLDGEFDIVVANAVLPLFDEEEFDRAIGSAAGALAPGGSLLAFDWFHPFEQHLTIVERSKTHPDGLRIHFRPYSRVRATLEEKGFADARFQPFRIPIDLPRPERDDEIVTYTRTADGGERLLFRGTLFQPWCHLVAQKTG